MPQIAIFDLDGTLLDTGKGIRNSVKYAENQMRLLPLNDDDLNKFVGPAPIDSYMRYHNLSHETAKEAVRLHREYSKMRGIYEAETYEGIETILGWLKSKGIMLAVATLKREELAIKILDHFNLSGYFNEICGTDIQESLTKIDLVRLVLQRTKCIAEQAVMIGDTEQDHHAANACNIKFIGVTYGYGYHSESQLFYQAANGEQLTACLGRALDIQIY